LDSRYIYIYVYICIYIYMYIYVYISVNSRDARDASPEGEIDEKRPIPLAV